MVKITKEGLEKIKEELNILKKEKRKEISKKIKHAAAFGDLSENAAYTEAKEEQAFVEGKIAELEYQIKNSEIIEGDSCDTIEVGRTVELKEEGGGKEEYTIVSPFESDPILKKISSKSPLGEKMIGLKIGDSFEILIPDGKIKYIIEKIK